VDPRPAKLTDLSWFVEVELADGHDTPASAAAKLRPFIEDGGARIVEPDAGFALWRVQELATVKSWTVFHELEHELASDDRFIEIFQLWVAPM
jgi:hypothetical protein